MAGDDSKIRCSCLSCAQGTSPRRKPDNASFLAAQIHREYALCGPLPEEKLSVGSAVTEEVDGNITGPRLLQRQLQELHDKEEAF